MEMVWTCQHVPPREASALQYLIPTWAVLRECCPLSRVPKRRQNGSYCWADPHKLFVLGVIGECLNAQAKITNQ